MSSVLDETSIRTSYVINIHPQLLWFLFNDGKWKIILHPYPDPDQSQNLIDWFLTKVYHSTKIWLKSINDFRDIQITNKLADRQTDRQRVSHYLSNFVGCHKMVRLYSGQSVIIIIIIIIIICEFIRRTMWTRRLNLRRQQSLGGDDGAVKWKAKGTETFWAAFWKCDK